MNHFFFDSSALIKRFTREPGDILVNELFYRVPGHRMACLMLGAAEVIAALVRKRNAGVIDAPTCAAAGVQFRSEVLDSVDVTKVAVDNRTVDASIRLIESHGLNATDAALLQSVIDQRVRQQAQGDDWVIVICDKRRLRAAQAEGLATFDPETQLQPDLDALLQP